MNKELIEQIRNGVPLHRDIDNLYLLKQVLLAAAPKDESIHRILGRSKYYDINFEQYRRIDNKPKRSIKLSSFIDTPKTISVEAVKEKLNEMLQDYQDEGNSDNSNINNRVIGAIRACNKLLTFLNTHTNVK